MDARRNFVDLIGGLCASIDLKYGYKKSLVVPTDSPVLAQDIVKKYNGTTNIHFLDSYKGTIRSPKKRNRKTYLSRFRKKLYKIVDFRYACGHAVATLDYADVIESLNIFFDLLNL